MTVDFLYPYCDVLVWHGAYIAVMTIAARSALAPFIAFFLLPSRAYLFDLLPFSASPACSCYMHMFH